MSSQSEIFREQGNQAFKQCTDGLPYVIYMSRLKKALGFYESARESAQINEQRASALKNIGVVYNKMSLIEPSGLAKGSFYLKALESLSEALLHGKKTKSPEWQDSIRNDIHMICSKSLLHFAGYEKLEDRLKYVYKIKAAVPSDMMRVHVQVRRSLVLGNLRWALSFLEERSYRQAIKILCDSSQYLEEGLSFCRQCLKNSEIIEISEELEEKKDSFDFIMKRAEALKEMANGNYLLNKAINSEESLIMDWIWDALDHFKHATILCKEKDIEIEAQLYGKIGLAYYKVLKLTSKAKEYLQTSIKLALSLGRNLSAEDWYEEINGYLREIREEEQKKEDADESKRREKMRELCKSEVEEIEKASHEKTNQDFIKFILNKFPPKNQTFELVESALEVSQMKKTLLKIIRLYHPDKQPQNDDKWCFLAEEISKSLTSIYERVYK